MNNRLAEKSKRLLSGIVATAIAASMLPTLPAVAETGEKYPYSNGEIYNNITYSMNYSQFFGDNTKYNSNTKCNKFIKLHNILVVCTSK